MFIIAAAAVVGLIVLVVHALPKSHERHTSFDLNAGRRAAANVIKPVGRSENAWGRW